MHRRYESRFFGDTKPSLVSNDYSTIVIFVVGGVTAQEIHLAHEFSQQIKKQVREKERPRQQMFLAL